MFLEIHVPTPSIGQLRLNEKEPIGEYQIPFDDYLWFIVFLHNRGASDYHFVYFFYGMGEGVRHMHFWYYAVGDGPTLVTPVEVEHVIFVEYHCELVVVTVLFELSQLSSQQ